MAREDTVWNLNYPGIIIRNDITKNPTFPQTVRDQLNLIISKPCGLLLLDGINECAIDYQAIGFKIAILRASNKVDLNHADAITRWEGGNVTRMTNEINGRDGTGTTSAIFYNPNVYQTPDGDRPPFIGLAHELIHAYHNLIGDTPATRHEDEFRVAGLEPYEDETITENKIRAEHNIPPRTQYSGI
jgi:hypothetical protein